MPHHLDWTELISFTPGLWTVGLDYLVPTGEKQAGAQVMDDCYPLPQGGLRAFAALSSFTTTGIGADEFCIGFYGRSGIPVRSGVTTEATDFYLVTSSTVDQDIRIYRKDETNDDGSGPHSATQWTVIETLTATTPAPGAAYFIAYTLSGGTTHVYVSIWTASGIDGLYRIEYSTGTVTKVTSHSIIRALTTHQDRIVYGTVEEQESRLRWNDPGTETFGSASFLDLLPFENLTDNVWAKSFIEDLLVGKSGAPFQLVQGPITDPTVRTLASVAHPTDTQQAAELPQGLVYQSLRNGIYITRSGAQIERLSSQLASNDVVSPTTRNTDDVTAGDLAYTDPFLWTPTGFIYDERTQAWFKSTTYPTSKRLFVDRHPDEQRIYMVTVGTGFSIYRQSISESDMGRVQAYTWKSPELRHPTGRQIQMRECQIYCDPQASGATISVVCNGVTRTTPSLNAGPQAVRLLFKEHKESLDLTVTSDSGSAGVEAPLIEAVRIGTLGNHVTT